MAEAVRDVPRSSDPSAHARVRRLDWRFLLPEPRLSCVAFSGPRNGSIHAALLHSAGRLFHPGDSGSGIRNESGCCEVAVVQGPGPVRVEEIQRLLSTGGWLYWETRCGPRARVDTPGTSGALDGVRAQVATFGGIRNSLRKLGFADISLHWHYPDFETCRWMIPLDDPSGCAFFLSRNRERLTEAALRSVGSALAMFPLLPRFACVSAVARKAASPSAEKSP